MEELKKEINKVIDNHKTTNTFRIAETKLLLQKNIHLLNGIDVDNSKVYVEKLYSDMVKELRIIFEIE